MKHLVTIMTILLFANLSAQNNYTDLWKQVEQHESKGLPKSALEIVNQIESKANSDENVSQQIKVLLFKSKYALILEEDAQLEIISNFKETIANSSFPKKNIVENMLAKLYWDYFQQNRWRFYDRTNTSQKTDEADFRTWDLQTLFAEIQHHYQNSLQDALLLQLEKLEKFDDVLHIQKDSKLFRPTLYDLLAHNALEFYKTSENSVTKPADNFKIDDPNYLSSSEQFAAITINSKDSTSLQLQALKLYQDLIQFHLKETEPDALVDVNIQRLNYVKQHAIFSNKESLLLEAYKTEKAKHTDHEVNGLYDFEIAQLYYQQGNTYQPQKNETHHWKIKEAYELAKSVIDKFPKSKAAQKCEVLLQQITQKSLQLQAEKYVSVSKNLRVLATYKNHSNLSFKAYAISSRQLQKFNETYRQEEQLAFIQKLKIQHEWNTTLKNEGDFQTHRTEIVVPPLTNGPYVLFAKANGSNEQDFAFTIVQATNLAIVDKSDSRKHRYQVINRNNGQPIEGSEVRMYFENNANGEYSKVFYTNSDGIFSMEKTRNGRYRNISMRVKNGDETAYFGNYYHYNYYSNDDDELTKYNSFLFTDRSIYRPGQTVYFKGIAIKTKDHKSVVLPDETANVKLHNVNGEEISTLTLKTNEYGSLSGEFILPNGGLTGQYYLTINGKKQKFSNTHYFSVEEYKRPKFEANFDPVTETYKVNDSVKITGKALAYAGSNITDAKVSYRVHRKVQYPRWYYWYRPWFNSEPQEITFGESTTDDKGTFEIIFPALPDESVDKSSLPTFKYEVTADITDINGETRSVSTIVNVGYHALNALLDIEDKLDKSDKNHKLSIETKNLNGALVSAKGNVKIYKLIPHSRVLRKRPWQAPDYQLLSETEFHKHFPHEAFTDEDKIQNWKRGELVLNKTFDTENATELALGNVKKWTSGRYVAVLQSTDKFGQEVKDETSFEIFSEDDRKVADNSLLTVTANKLQFAPNETAELTFGSAAKLSITVEVEKDQKVVHTEILELNSSKKTIKIPVNKEDLGGFVVHYSTAAFNSFVNGVEMISVPYPKTDLQIETSIFRDKLQPGADETWSFKVKGPKGEQVSAELLASMYDASLDQFKPHTWSFNPLYQPIYYSNYGSRASNAFGVGNFRIYNSNRYNYSYPNQGYDRFNWFGFYFGNNNFRIRGMASAMAVNDEAELDEVVVTAQGIRREKKALGYAFSEVAEDSVEQLNAGGALEATVPSTEQTQNIDFSGVTIRKNLQETAFFFPHLSTDEKGNVTFSFTTPEALTKWKLQLVGHTKTLESAVAQFETVTQKELMVIPNTPRFLREGDQITISTKIANLSDKSLSGTAVLQLVNALNGTSIDGELSNTYNELGFEVGANGNTNVSWKLDIPDTVQAVQYKIIAKTAEFSDGEQNALPVLSNRMLVTETLPMWIKSNESRTFTLDKLATNSSTTLKHHKLTLEITSNPAWYAVQALPYLMEYPYECNEQTFSRYYANALASHIANSNPRIQEVFNQWRNSEALISNLEKNQELKSLLIQETPWLRDAQSESEQKKHIALLFDLNKMKNESTRAIRKLKQNQMSSGAWPWFKGGYANRWITQHIITGFGHLKQLNVISNEVEQSMIKKAISYLDAQFVQEYKDIRKYDKDADLSKDRLSYTQLHYLYMRSFFPEIKVSSEVAEIQTYYFGQIQKYWLSRSLYAKGMMALVTHRNNNKVTSGAILASLKENSITSDELGMYWKENTNSLYWYQAPIETQALMIETFSEIGDDIEVVDNLKIWLLKNKQTNRWKTTKATTEAVYALLLQGSDWLSVTDMVDVVIGNKTITPSTLEDVQIEAGTGYYKTSWNPENISPEMANVKLTKKGDGIAWGSMYWQYFEDLDKITSSETPLKLKKKLFLRKYMETGEQLSEINTKTNLEIGDLVRVRIELRSDRDMEFIHMKDMRAAGFEPINVLSQYKWQDGLGYYESTKDAATNFFFDYLPKGVYVFEYDLRVTNSGDMSNGITTIQSMYAPEFSSHSEGVRVLVN